MSFPEVRQASRGADLDLGILEVAHQRPRKFPRRDGILWIRPGAVEIVIPDNRRRTKYVARTKEILDLPPPSIVRCLRQRTTHLLQALDLPPQHCSPQHANTEINGCDKSLNSAMLYFG